MRKRLSLLLALCALLPAACAFAQPIEVDGAWIRLLPGDLPLAGYFTLHNGGSRTLKLIGASSPAFRRIELHHSMNMHGMEKMVPVREITIPAGGNLAFAPGGYHLMLWRARPFRVGGKIPVTLKFSGGRTLKVEFLVKSAAGD